MISEKRTFEGLNNDADERSLRPGDYVFPALNITIGNRIGIISNTLGNTKVTYKLPVGDNEVIGSYEDKVNQYVYYFIWNNLDSHRIARYDPMGGAVVTILENSVLNFDRIHKITGVNVYEKISTGDRTTNEYMLYWTDDYNEPRKINVNYAIPPSPFAYQGPFQSDYLDVIKYPPLSRPTLVVTNDATKGYNYQTSHCFQFRYSWVYDDYEESAMSPISEVAFGGKENNLIKIIYYSGFNNVRKTRLYGRIGNIGDWFLIETIIVSSPLSYDYYSFYNEKAYVGVDQRLAIKLFDKVPIKAKAQEIIEGDRLVYGDYVEDYDNPEISASITMQPNVISGVGQGEGYNIGKGLKYDYSGQFGIAYMDKGGRMSAVVTDDNLKVSHSVISSHTATTYNSFTPQITITSQPPAWAVKYGIYRLKNRKTERYVDFVPYRVYSLNAAGVKSFVPSNLTSTATTLLIDTSSIVKWAQASGAQNVFADFQVGDRLRIKGFTDPAAPTPTTDMDLPITKVDGDFVYVENKFGVDPLYIATALVEIYKPATIATDIYYEVSQADILNPGTNTRYHAALNTLGAQNQTAILPCVFRVETFDTYYRIVDFGKYVEYTRGAASFTLPDGTVVAFSYGSTMSGLDFNVLIESPSIADYASTHASDIGRPNIVSPDVKQTRRPTSITYSETFVADTEINGFSSFYDDSFERYSNYGSIQKLYYHNKTLKVFQESKVGQVGVNTRMIFDNSGQSLLAGSEKVLNQIQYYSAEFGISKNPESFAIFGDSIYFIDMNRGAVLRLANNGIVPISDYGMFNYFKDKFKTFSSLNQDYVKVYGVYNRTYRQYIISFYYDQYYYPSFDVNNPNNETIAFYEPTNRWTSTYSWAAESLSTSGTGFISFKEGALWKHDNGPVNTFYGVFTGSKISIVANKFPSNIKSFDQIGLEGNKAWGATITTSQGQASNLITSDFEEINGEYLAGFLRDSLTPNTPNPLLEGDELQGAWLKCTLTDDTTTDTDLYCANIAFVNSDFVYRT